MFGKRTRVWHVRQAHTSDDKASLAQRPKRTRWNNNHLLSIRLSGGVFNHQLQSGPPVPWAHHGKGQYICSTPYQARDRATLLGYLVGTVAVQRLLPVWRRRHTRACRLRKHRTHLDAVGFLRVLRTNSAARTRRRNRNSASEL